MRSGTWIDTKRMSVYVYKTNNCVKSEQTYLFAYKKGV